MSILIVVLRNIDKMKAGMRLVIGKKEAQQKKTRRDERKNKVTQDRQEKKRDSERCGKLRS